MHRKSLSSPPSPHGSPCGSLQVWGAPTPQISLSRASTSPVRGGQTEGQLFPAGTAGTVPMTTQALLQQLHPPCIKQGLRKGLLHPSPSPQDPLHAPAARLLARVRAWGPHPASPLHNVITSTCSLLCPPLASVCHPATAPGNPASTHRARPRTRLPSCWEQLGQLRAGLRPAVSGTQAPHGDASPPWHLYIDHGMSQPWKPHTKQG